MKGILLKDLYVYLKAGRYLVFLSLIYCIIAAGGSNTFFASCGVLFLAMTPITVMGYDERSKWDQYAVMLPYSRQDMVLSKYLLAIIGIVIALLVYVGASFLFLLAGKEISMKEVFRMAFFNLSGSLIYIAMNLPIMFRFGVERGRIGFLALTALLVGAMVSLGFIASAAEEAAFQIPVWKITAAVFVLSAVMFVVSIAVSKAIFEKREL